MLLLADVDEYSLANAATYCQFDTQEHKDLLSECILSERSSRVVGVDMDFLLHC